MARSLKYLKSKRRNNKNRSKRSRKGGGLENRNSWRRQEIRRKKYECKDHKCIAVKKGKYNSREDCMKKCKPV